MENSLIIQIPSEVGIQIPFVFKKILNACLHNLYFSIFEVSEFLESKLTKSAEIDWQSVDSFEQFIKRCTHRYLIEVDVPNR